MHKNKHANDETTGTNETSDKNGSEPLKSEARQVDTSSEIILSTRPTIKPVLIWLSVALAIGGGLCILLFSSLELFGSPQLTEILGAIVALITTLVTVQLLVRTYILLRTQYTITDSALQSEFNLFYRRKSRELPFDRVRGFDVEQDRIQSVLNIGTVSVLTGGTHYSIGFLRFEHIPNPDLVQESIRNQIQVQNDQ